MKRLIVLAAFALATVVLADPALAKKKHWDNDWQAPWDQCNGWNCDQWQPGWQNPAWPVQPGWGQQPWQPGWQPGWQNNWQDDDFDGRPKKWRNQHGLVPQELVARKVRQHGYERIYEISLDDDKPIYKVRARDGRGRIYKLFFDARNGQYISKTRID